MFLQTSVENVKQGTYYKCYKVIVSFGASFLLPWAGLPKALQNRNLRNMDWQRCFLFLVTHPVACKAILHLILKVSLKLPSKLRSSGWEVPRSFWILSFPFKVIKWNFTFLYLRLLSIFILFFIELIGWHWLLELHRFQVWILECHRSFFMARSGGSTVSMVMWKASASTEGARRWVVNMQLVFKLEVLLEGRMDLKLWRGRMDLKVYGSSLHMIWVAHSSLCNESWYVCMHVHARAHVSLCVYMCLYMSLSVWMYVFA